VVHDRGSIVMGWLLRVALTLALLAVVGFELLSIAVTHVAVTDIGAQSADAAQTSWSEAHDVTAAYEAAEAYAESQGATIARHSFGVNSDGSMRFVVRKTAPTLVLSHIKQLAKWAVVTTPVDVPPLQDTGVAP
jgi:hypothetical protein